MRGNDYFFIILALNGAIIVVLVLINVATKIFGLFDDVESRPSSRSEVGGTVTRDAGLLGLKTNERTLVLDFLLRSKVSKNSSIFLKSCFVVLTRNVLFWSFPIVQKFSVEKIVVPVNFLKSDDVAQSNIPESSPYNNNTISNDDELAIEGLQESDANISCAICLSNYGACCQLNNRNKSRFHLKNTDYFNTEEGDSIVDLKECHHMFHKECLMEWLGRSDKCPFCRKDVISSEEFKNAVIHVLGIEP